MELHPRKSGWVEVELATMDEMQAFALYGLRRVTPQEFRASLRIYRALEDHQHTTTVRLTENALLRVGDRLTDQADHFDNHSCYGDTADVAATCRALGSRASDYVNSQLG